MHIPDLNSQGRALVRRIFLITILVLSSGLNTVTTSYYSFKNRHLTVFVITTLFMENLTFNRQNTT